MYLPVKPVSGVGSSTPPISNITALGLLVAAVAMVATEGRTSCRASAAVRRAGAHNIVDILEETSNKQIAIFLFKSDLDRRTIHPKFDLTRIRTYDIWITNRLIHATETLILITDPSGTSLKLRVSKQVRTSTNGMQHCKQ